MKEAGTIRIKMGKLQLTMNRMLKDTHQSSLLNDEYSVLDGIQQLKDEISLVPEDTNLVLKKAVAARVSPEVLKGVKAILDEQKFLLDSEYSKFVHKKATVGSS